MLKKTPLHAMHRQSGARLVEFAGFEMPLHYGSQLEEHRQVRQAAGMFDISHMAIIDIAGAQSREWLRMLLANHIDRLKQKGRALYSCMLNEEGGILDDVIVYYLDETSFRMVANAATRAKDLAWLAQRKEGFAVDIRARDDLAMIAVQGPKALLWTEPLLPPALQGISRMKPFSALWQADWFISRTGYTGEDGYELMLPHREAVAFWCSLQEKNVRPCGLGARDTLRLEAGMNLYGMDMDETTSPYECGLGWTVAWQPEERLFIGRAALSARLKSKPLPKWVGLVLKDKGILRPHQKVIVEGVGEGNVTSGGFSPTLGKSIALARVPPETGRFCQVLVRGEAKRAAVVKPCFVRHGRAQVAIDDL